MSMMIHTEARIKGGMPILVDAEIFDDGDVCCIEFIELNWLNTGKPVSVKFEETVNNDDWSAINEAVWEAYHSR